MNHYQMPGGPLPPRGAVDLDGVEAALWRLLGPRGREPQAALDVAWVLDLVERYAAGREAGVGDVAAPAVIEQPPPGAGAPAGDPGGGAAVGAARACAACGAVKPLATGFYVQRGRADGRFATCKACLTARRRARRHELARLRRASLAAGVAQPRQLFTSPAG